MSKEQVRNHNTSSPVRWLISHVRPYWYIGIILIIGAIGNAVLAAYIPRYIGQIFDILNNSNLPNKMQLIQTIAIALGVSQVIRGLLQLGRNFSAELIGQFLEYDIRDELYSSLLEKSMTFHAHQSIGDIMARATNDVREINLLFNPGINLVIGSANFLIMPVILSPGYHPNLVITPIIYIIFYIVALWQYLRELQPVTRGLRNAFGKLNTRLAESIDGIETVKGLAEESTEINIFSRRAARFRDSFVHQGRIEAKFIPLLLMGLAQGFGLFHALSLHRVGQISPGDVAAYFGLLMLFGFPTFVSLFAYSQISLGLASSERILELINQKSIIVEEEDAFEGSIDGKVEFNGVHLKYENGPPVLIDINLNVPTGSTVALVGQTGSGKTSLIQLLNRIYDPSKGEILIDERNIKSWNLESLRSQIAVIEQDIFLFNKSIAENIAFGMPTVEREKVILAAKDAQAHEFILSMEEGYETVIGERGVTLSGGQRQRIALARAFLMDPKILILDDSTSSIDSATEDEIQKAIFRASEGRTTFIITHRLSQIRWADLIVLLRSGEIEAIGSHEEMMKISSHYQNLFIA